MLSSKEYYTAPSPEIFDDIKESAIELWRTYDDTFGYATQKVDRVKDIKNLSDNYAYIVGMFDIHNQTKLLSMVKLPETKKLILDLLVFGMSI